MTLHAFTARISSRDTDALNITRKSAKADGIAFAPSWPLLMRGKRNEVTSDEYARLYIVEMRESYRRNRAQWDALLARERVTCVCYCVDHLKCHRTVFAREILPRLGAVYCGELGVEVLPMDALMARIAGDSLQRTTPPSYLDCLSTTEASGYLHDPQSVADQRVILDALQAWQRGRAAA